ncbi:WYL domain-containing protein [Brevibacterium aurantiacum]|nr:WYL domain-containing protein [Brevibacterium aurantiacum]
MSTMTVESRLLSLLGMLAAGRTYTAGELGAHFGVTPRSVRRDIASLRELGYVIESLPGATGGYRAHSRTVLPPLQLQTGEALATAVGLSLLNGAGLSTTDVESATAKLRTMLPPVMHKTIGDISTAVSVLPGHEPGVDMTAVMTTTSAIASRNVLTFAHEKRRPTRSETRSETTQRRVEPVRMVVLGGHWYLYGWDLTRSDWRVFRLDRMSEIHETTFAFAPRDHPDAEVAVSSAVTTAAYRHTVILEVDATVAETKAWFPTRTATITNSGDGARVEFGVEDLAWAAVITAATPVDFRVIEPPELLDALRDLGQRAAQVSRTGSTEMVAAERSEQ